MDLNEMTIIELRALAKKEGIKGLTGLRKGDLVAELSKRLDSNTSGSKSETAARTESGTTPVKKSPLTKTESSMPMSRPERGIPVRSYDSSSYEIPSGQVGVKKPADQIQKPVRPAYRPVQREYQPGMAPQGEYRPAPQGEYRPAPQGEYRQGGPAPVRRDQNAGGFYQRPVSRDAAQAGGPARRPYAPAGRSFAPAPGAGRENAPARSGFQARPVSRPEPPVEQSRPAPAPAPEPKKEKEKEKAPQTNEKPAAENPIDAVTNAPTLAASIEANYALEGNSFDSGETKEGILEVMPEGFGFIRCANFLPGNDDVYVAPSQIKRFGLKTGDYIVGNTKVKTPAEKFSALLYIKTINKIRLEEVVTRPKFEDLTPVFPNSRYHLETPGCGPSMRMVDLLSPIGKGQRGMIVSQPKAGKTTLLKQVAKALIRNHPSIHLIILLIDERPEEVTDMKESINGENVEVIYSTFDELPDNHRRVSEMVIERAKRLVEQKQDVVILLDSITRLARAYNLTVTASGRTLSGGLDPAALYMPKKFFGAARCMREGGSLTVLATALVDTGSRMDDVVFEEFKGTGNMELVLDRNLSERRVFPAIDLPKSGTRREDLLLTPQELEASAIIRRAFNSAKTDEVVERIISLFTHTRNNLEFVDAVKKTRIIP